MMRVFMAILCSLLAVCSVSARGQLSEGDGRAGVNLPPAAFRAGGSLYEVF